MNTKIQPAGFKPRIMAFLIDYVIIIGYILVLTGVTLLLLTVFPALKSGTIFANPYASDFLAFVTLVLPVLLYFALFESSAWQATPGKRRMRLKVTNLAGERISLWRAVVRAAVKLLPWQVAHTSLFHIPGWPLAVVDFPAGAAVGFGIVWVLVGVYLVMLATTHRPPYDLAAGSIVIISTSTR
jgi:uncharacterized RDD family membrane protein YckC